jgi:beta-galactosidase
MIFCTSLFAVEVNKGQQIITLDSYWKFNIDPNNEGVEKKWHTASMNDDSWAIMPVPGNWDLYNEYANYKGNSWYRTTFKTPLAKNKQIILSIGEVGMSYKIFLNGKQVADILCGNYMEQFDITSHLKQGVNNVLS